MRYIKWLLAILVLIGVSVNIPNSWLYDNYKESALFVEQVGNFSLTSNAIVMNEADRNQLDIAYGLDSWSDVLVCPAHPLYVGEGVGLSMLQDDSERQPYPRYWHGTAYIIRILLIFFDLFEIRCILLGTYLVLMMLTTYLMCRKGQWRLAMAYLLGNICAESFGNAYICMTMPVWIIMTMCVWLVLAGKKVDYIIVGFLTVFFDYLTCETLTLTMPVVISLVLAKEVNVLRSIIEWSSGYLGGWLLRFGLCAITGNFANVATGFEVHSDLLTDNIFTEIINSLYFNFRNTIPLCYISNTTVVIVLLLVFYVYIIARYRKVLRSYALILSIPILRLIVLSSHSLEHSFYMFRSLEPMLLVISYCIVSKPFKCKLGIEAFKR